MQYRINFDNPKVCLKSELNHYLIMAMEELLHMRTAIYYLKLNNEIDVSLIEKTIDNIERKILGEKDSTWMEVLS